MVLSYCSLNPDVADVERSMWLNGSLTCTAGHIPFTYRGTILTGMNK